MSDIEVLEKELSNKETDLKIYQTIYKFLMSRHPSYLEFKKCNIQNCTEYDFEIYKIIKQIETFITELELQERIKGLEGGYGNN